MTESYVIQIAGGNTLLNKVSLLLNQAGDSPNNPMLRGLGLSVDLKFSLSILSFTAKLGQNTPPKDKSLTFSIIGEGQYRLSGAAGYGSLGLSKDYVDAAQHFLGITMVGPSHTIGTERQFWVKSNPKIELAFTNAQDAWSSRASKAYFKIIESDVYGLTFDPGIPPVVGLWPDDESNPVGWVEVGEDRIVEIGLYDVNQIYPLDLPIRLMDDWKDEFDQKHYGGAKYVSVFEEGMAEDATGTYIQNEYQKDIKELNNLRILTADSDHEYRIVFRFRSELNDSYYVDKTIRFRILTSDVLNAEFTTDIYETGMPNVIYNAATNKFYWCGMTAAVAAHNFTSATVIIDDKDVSLPLDDTTEFPADWLNIRAVIYGGEIPIRFIRDEIAGVTEENVIETYTLNRPAGAGLLPITIDKSLFRRFIHSHDATFAADTQFRFIEPVAGDIYLEFINNQTVHKQVTVWTDKGSYNVPVPIRNGRQINITNILDIEPITGSIEQDHINILLQTENTTRILEIEPNISSPKIRARCPAWGTYPYSDFVMPIVTPSYPDMEIEWPEKTEYGEDYTILPYSGFGGAGGTVNYMGRKGGYRHNGPQPNNTYVLPNVLSLVAYPNNSKFFVWYRIKFTSGPLLDSVQDYLVEYNTWEGYTGIPDTGYHDGAVKVILYEDILVIVTKPSDLLDIDITGNLGTQNYPNANIMENQWYDISHVIDTVHTPLVLEYRLIDHSVSPPVITPYGPFNIPRYIPMAVNTVQEMPVNGEVWDTGRLTNADVTLPQAKINYIDKTIQFKFLNRFFQYIRWSAANPLDRTRLTFNGRALNLTDYDITRLFREDAPYELQSGQSVLVTFLHPDGPQLTALYEIGEDFVEPVMLNYLRGEL